MAISTGKLVMFSAAALALGSVVAAPSAAARPCPWGTSPTSFEGVCAPGGSGGTAGGGAVLPQTSAGGANVVSTPGGVGSVNGIPCTPEHYGTCLSMIQNGQ